MRDRRVIESAGLPAARATERYAALLLLLALAGSSLTGAVAAASAPGQPEFLTASTAPATPSGSDAVLDPETLATTLAEAKADWQAVSPSADLTGISATVADLPGQRLGSAAGNALTVDDDAAGRGWDAMDLRTVLRHEIGHALGWSHTSSGLMSHELDSGSSHLVGAEYAAHPPEHADTGTAFLTAQDTEPPAEDPPPADPPAEDPPAQDPPAADPPAADPPVVETAAADPPAADPPAEDPPAEDPPADEAKTSDAPPAEDTTETNSLMSTSSDESFSASLATTGGATGTAGDDVIQIVDNGDGTYDIMIGTEVLGTVSGTDTFTIDGLEGIDILQSPDLNGVWKITGINAGSYQIIGGPTFEFTNLDSLTGAATADDEFQFDDGAGLAGAIDDGAGQTMISILSRFVRIWGDFTFERDAAYNATVNGAAGTILANVLKVWGTTGNGFNGFVGTQVGGQSIGVSGTLGAFMLAVVTSIDQAWHAFIGTLTNATLGGTGVLDLGMTIGEVSIGVNGKSEDGSSLDLSQDPITSTGSTKRLEYSAAQESATMPVLMDVGGFLHVQGNITLTRGGISTVDINTGLNSTTGPGSDIAGVVVAESDPTDGSMARSEDYKTLWNVAVSALQFAFSSGNAFIGTGFAWNPSTDSDGQLSADDLTGSTGLFAGGISLAFLLLTPLGATPISTRFVGLKGTVDDFDLVGLDDLFSLSLSGIEFEANLGGALVDGAPDAFVDWVDSFPDPNQGDDTTGPGGTDPTPEGYRVFIGGTDPPALYLDSNDSAIRFSADRAVLSIAGFVHIGGSFALEQGGREEVDVEVENLANTPAYVEEIGNILEEDDGTLATNDDGSMIWNLPVETLLLGISNGSIFVGYNPGGFDADVAVPLGVDDLAEGALGLLATGLTLGLVVASPRGLFDSNSDLPSFLAIRGEVDLLTPVGLPSEVTLYFEGIQVLLNRGGAVGSDAGSLATVDWEASFPAEGDGDAGLAVPAGGGNEVIIDMADPITAVKADRVVLSISRFLHVVGGFSFEIGGDEVLDLETSGLTVAQRTALANAVNNTDPADDALATNATATLIYNLPVKTILIGISNASFFAGDNPNVIEDADLGTPPFDISHGNPDILDRADLEAVEGCTEECVQQATGFLAAGINIGIVLASVDGTPITGWKFGSFFAMKAEFADMGPIGLPSEFVLDFDDVVISVNRGGRITRTTGTPVAATARAVVNWAASFPSDDEETDGLSVPTSPDPDDAVYVDFDDAIIGVSAGRIVLAISDFVYISGGFAFEQGGTEDVDIDTAGLGVDPTSAGRLLANAINGTNGEQATDPEDGSTGATKNAETIWNVSVITTLLGISKASVFVGYNPNLQGEDGTSFNTGDDTILDEDDLHPDSVGVLANNISVGLVFARVEPIPGLTTWDDQLPRFWTINALIGLLTPVGLPDELKIRFEGVGLEINRGGLVNKVATTEAWINWEKSFPNSEPTEVGIPVPTGKNNPIVYVDTDDPVLGISATKIVVAISDFVYLSGGFAFEKGGRETVDIDTAGLDPLTTGALLAGQIAASTGCTLTEVTTRPTQTPAPCARRPTAPRSGTSRSSPPCSGSTTPRCSSATTRTCRAPAARRSTPAKTGLLTRAICTTKRSDCWPTGSTSGWRSPGSS